MNLERYTAMVWRVRERLWVEYISIPTSDDYIHVAHGILDAFFSISEELIRLSEEGRKQ